MVTNNRCRRRTAKGDNEQRSLRERSRDSGDDRWWRQWQRPTVEAATTERVEDGESEVKFVWWELRMVVVRRLWKGRMKGENERVRVGMCNDMFQVVVHHSETLIKEVPFKYMGVEIVYWDVDPDKWCYFGVLGSLKDLGYMEVKELYYNTQHVLHKLDDDKGAMNMMKVANYLGKVNLYVVHGVDEPAIVGNDENEILYLCEGPAESGEGSGVGGEAHVQGDDDRIGDVVEGVVEVENDDAVDVENEDVWEDDKEDVENEDVEVAVEVQNEDRVEFESEEVVEVDNVDEVEVESDELVEVDIEDGGEVESEEELEVDIEDEGEVESEEELEVDIEDGWEVHSEE
ncbi:hypothetical protein LR48_Vigan02g060700 [Vigna angularis]|uniref:PB1-like domain-containing protein n=1 Tax=Phaseolus angularis TaxID=3914 RepID=A0A0L9TVP0_PHAAN|nr:hypothetical protein LR48_Vigan02g060700 [Vigna angularis]